MKTYVSLLSRQEMLRAAPFVNPSNAVVTRVRGGTEAIIDFQILSQDGKATRRHQSVMDSIQGLLGRADVVIDKRFVFQGDDRPVDTPSASWQRRKGGSRITMLPDFYYTENNGYKSFLSDEVKSWCDRSDCVVWRGATTGALQQTVDGLASLPRYTLCRIGREMGSIADFGIYNIVQTKDEEQRLAIKAVLQRENLLRSHMDLVGFQYYKFFVQMDGNGNSWELIKKLRLGCCMIYVGSSWELWHDQFIRPWEHFVPVSEDLSDLKSKIEWCLSNDDACRAIASKGRQYALSIDYDAEMKEAAQRLLAVDSLEA